MGRRKIVPFADALAVWAETAPEEEIRDCVVSLSIYARSRGFKWRIRIEPVVEKPLPLLEGK